MCCGEWRGEYERCLALHLGPYTESRLDRYHIGIPRELSEIRTQPWLSEGSLTCDPCHHRVPMTYINHSDEGNKMMSIATYNINIQFKHVLVNHSDVSSRLCLETTHRVHNDGLTGM